MITRDFPEDRKDLEIRGLKLVGVGGNEMWYVSGHVIERAYFNMTCLKIGDTCVVYKGTRFDLGTLIRLLRYRILNSEFKTHVLIHDAYPEFADLIQELGEPGYYSNSPGHYSEFPMGQVIEGMVSSETTVILEPYMRLIIRNGGK